MIKFILNKLLYRTSSDRFIKYLRERGMKIGKGTTFLSPNHTFIDEGRSKWISIGDNCTICRNVTILAHDYSWSTLVKSHGVFLPTGGGEVKIRNNVFIGEGAMILRNVDIGNNVIVGAGSVCVKNIPSNSVVAGVPAQIIMSLDDYFCKRSTDLISEAKINYNYLQNNHIEINETTMKNFSPLYMERSEENIKTYLVENGCVGFEESELRNYLSQTKPMFNSFLEFIEHLSVN